jgi:hypothetical protein
MSIIPPTHYDYSLKFSPAALASDYAGWRFIERSFDQHGAYIAIERSESADQYLLRGRIADEWLVQNMTDEQIAAVL